MKSSFNIIVLQPSWLLMRFVWLLVGGHQSRGYGTSPLNENLAVVCRNCLVRLLHKPMSCLRIESISEKRRCFQKHLIKRNWRQILSKQQCSLSIYCVSSGRKKLNRCFNVFLSSSEYGNSSTTEFVATLLVIPFAILILAAISSLDDPFQKKILNPRSGIILRSPSRRLAFFKRRPLKNSRLLVSMKLFCIALRFDDPSNFHRKIAGPIFASLFKSTLTSPVHSSRLLGLLAR